MSPHNVAAWIRFPKADLEIDEAPYTEPGTSELLIKVSVPQVSKMHIEEQFRMKLQLSSLWMRA